MKIAYKYLIIAMIFTFLFCIPTPAATFSDPQLNKAVIRALNGQTPTSKNLAQITELYLFKKDIRSLAGIEQLVNLERLEASGNSITDITPLSRLNKLTVLSLGGNGISNLAPLGSLVNLRQLELFGNNITDISPLSNLTNIETLYLNNNKITDISSLAKLNSLSVLETSGNQIINPAVLKSLPNLKQANGNNQPTDITISPTLEQAICKAISKPSGQITETDLRKVTTLNLSGQPSLNISGISQLIYLKNLNLDNTGITDLSELASLHSLESLSLKNNDITDVEPLRGLSCLKELNLAGNNISDYSPLIPLLNRITKRDFKAVSDYPVGGVINIKHDGKYLIFGEYSYIENGVTLVPARSFLEYFDFQVTWDNTTGMVKAEKPGMILKIPTRNATGYCNNQKINLTVPARIQNGKVFVPMRFVVESLNLTPVWDPETRCIEVV